MTTSRPIVIVGFMASGKTSVAEALAREMACAAIDLDQLITQRTGRTPAEIINDEGEAAFREVESSLLEEIVGSSNANVIALGGGAWTIESNRRLIQDRNGVAIWLDVPFEVCWERIARDPKQRPLARDKQSAYALYGSRQIDYALAQIVVAQRSPSTCEALAKKLARILRQETLEPGASGEISLRS